MRVADVSKGTSFLFETRRIDFECENIRGEKLNRRNVFQKGSWYRLKKEGRKETSFLAPWMGRRDVTVVEAYDEGATNCHGWD